MPGKPFQSKLLPHTEFIRECRAEGMGYRQIAADLRMRFGLKTAAANVFSFVKVRARRRPVFTLPPHESAATAPGARPTVARVTLPRPATGGNWLNYDPSKPLEKIPS
jgi:hypothetical protein